LSGTAPSSAWWSRKYAGNRPYNETPVLAVGSHDHRLRIGSMPLVESAAYISSGTWSLMGIETKKTDISEKLQ